MLLLPPTSGGYPNLELGFKNIGDTTALRLELTAAPTRCGTEVPFWATLQNIACQAASGRFGIVSDSLVAFQSATPTPDLISPGLAGRDTLWWQFDSIQPSQFQAFRMTFLMPDASHVGDSIQLPAFLFLKNDQQAWSLKDSSHFRSEIRCAFDLNDKMVNRPVLPPDYLPAESTLLYTVRFQNTGNDTASVVTVRDTLDYSLDLNTFQALGASHAYRCELNWIWHSVAFVFNNIALPDSNVNELQSHGFVSFSIQPYPGLLPDDPISNRADIFFDQNPAISTNWIETFVQFPVVTEENASQPSAGILMAPNPNTGTFMVELPQPAGPGTLFKITDLTGRLLLEEQTVTSSERQIVHAGALPPGLYFLQVVAEGRVLAVEKFVKQ